MILNAYDRETKKYYTREDLDEIQVEIEYGEILIYNTIGEELLLLDWIGKFDMDDNGLYEGSIVEIYPRDKEHYGEKAVYFIYKRETLWGSSYSWNCLEGYECSTHILEWNHDDNRLKNVRLVGNVFEDNKYTREWDFSNFFKM